LDVPGFVSDTVYKVVEYIFLHVQPGPGATTLPMVEKDRAGSTGNGKVHINVTKDDVRGLAAQLKGNLLQIIRGSFDNQLANFR